MTLPHTRLVYSSNISLHNIWYLGTSILAFTLFPEIVYKPLQPTLRLDCGLRLCCRNHKKPKFFKLAKEIYKIG